MAAMEAVAPAAMATAAGEALNDSSWADGEAQLPLRFAAPALVSAQPQQCGVDAC